MNEKIDPATLQRQKDCRHSWIQGLADNAPICPRCGLPKHQYHEPPTYPYGPFAGTAAP